MNRLQAIEKATHFRIGHLILNAQDGTEREFASERVTYYARKGENGEKTTYHKKIHHNELVPSISRAKHFVRDSDMKVVAARDKTDEIHMRLLVAKRIENEKLKILNGGEEQ